MERCTDSTFVRESMYNLGYRYIVTVTDDGEQLTPMYMKKLDDIAGTMRTLYPDAHFSCERIWGD